MRRRLLASSSAAVAARPAAGTASPATPLSVMDMASPASPPATQASWWMVSDAARVEERISSGISRCTIESSASLASTWLNAATRATTSAAHRPKNAAQAAVIAVDAQSSTNRIRCGARAFSSAPIPVPMNPPAPAAAIIAPSASLSLVPGKCTVRSRNARKKIM